MEINSKNSGSDMEAVEDESFDQALSPCSSHSNYVFGDPLLLPRIGHGYQAEVSPPTAEHDCSKAQVNLESENTVDNVERNLSPLHDSFGGSLKNDLERDGFLLGLYLFGKNFVLVKKFVEVKDMGDILSFYYGKFYRSTDYVKWSRCRKQKCKQAVHGKKIFSGWRQRELLSRLSSYVSDECHCRLVEDSRAFTLGEISLEEYVFALKNAVDINVLVEAIAIGKGKQDLTLKPVKPKNPTLARQDIPIGKGWSSHSSADIIKFLKGDVRLSKARCCDLFWEAVWPRLLVRGWHSEKPDGHSFSSSKHSLVFLVPGVKKFSRRRLVKGEHYFDSVSDVLNRVASDPGVLEIENEAANESRSEEENGQPKQEQDVSKNKHNSRYLQPLNLNCKRVLQKFLIIDTSLGCGAEAHKVRELRSLPVETTCASVSSSLSSEESGDTSEESREEAEEINNSKAAPTATNSKSHTTDANVVVLENHGDRSMNMVNNGLQSIVMEHNQFLQEMNCSNSKHLIPRKQQNVICYKRGALSSNNISSSGDRKRSMEEDQSKSSLPDTSKAVAPLGGQPHKSSSAGSGVKDSPYESKEGIIFQSLPSQNCDTSEPVKTDTVCNDYKLSADEIQQNSDDSNRYEQPKREDDKSPSTTSNRRQSKRNRPLTTKVLEAMEMGLLNVMKKRKVGKTNI